jgi:glycosyltransferase involved in cell wall biosynthesis
MNHVRVLHIVGNSSFGGAAKIILRLAQMAKAEGWHVDILTTDPAFQQAAIREGIGSIGLDVIHREIRPLWDLGGLLRLYRFLRREHYSVVHTHTSKAGFVGRLAAWLVGVPVIVHTVHGFAFHEQSALAVGVFYSALERAASHWCDRVVSVSEFHRRWAQELGICGPDKILAIPNGIAQQSLTARTLPADTRRSLGVEPQDLVILSTGRLAPEKGLEHLIEAAFILARSGQRFRVVLAGDGPLRGQLERLARDLDVTGRVSFLGYREDIPDLLAACDLVVLPSLREGLSIALLEAMAVGKPIVATNIGSNSWVAAGADMALLVPTCDPQALSDAILRCAKDAVLRARLGSNARRSFETRYTEDKMLNSYRQLYLDLVKANCPGDAPVLRARRKVDLTRSPDALDL